VYVGIGIVREGIQILGTTLSRVTPFYVLLDMGIKGLPLLLGEACTLCVERTRVSGHVPSSFASTRLSLNPHGQRGASLDVRRRVKNAPTCLV
jgi:hypothetical protein